MKTNYFILSVLTAWAWTLFSCNSDADHPDGALPDAEPILLKEEFQVKTENNRSFALELFKTTMQEFAGENVFISPYSVNTALNLAWNGAAGETFDEMGVVLGNSTYTREQINEYAKTLTDALVKADPSTELRIANSVWADHTTPFLSSFVQTTQTWYDAVVNHVDFKDPETLRMIDRWGLEHTHNKIDKISEGMSAETSFALINAVYFHAKWKYRFDTSDTRMETFTNSTGKQASVKMMTQTADLRYAGDGRDWKMLALPYGNGAFSMVVLMPYCVEPLDKKAASLTADTYYSLVENLYPHPVTVKLPAFKAECTYKLHENILPSMGMRQVFDPYTADMSGMCASPAYINGVVHKTYVEVDEEGTEAAAVTTVEVLTTSIPEEINFFVDRPFIYSILENSTGTILFMGCVNEL
ncbi:MAG: serpin family protein [Bacteroides sp.]|nr:serpin family protein [Bacteroides sp.]